MRRIATRKTIEANYPFALLTMVSTEKTLLAIATAFLGFLEI
jgi:hypothetical protein